MVGASRVFLLAEQFVQQLFGHAQLDVQKAIKLPV